MAKWPTPEVAIIGIFVLLKYKNGSEIVASDISFNSVSPKPLTYLKLYSNSFSWQQFPIYFRLKLNRNANIISRVSKKNENTVALHTVRHL